MAAKHVLSKSTFMAGCQCPKRLYLHKKHPELSNPEDEDLQAIFSRGTTVGLLARELFKGGIDVAPPDPFSYHLSVAKTQELIAANHSVIYEAAFMYDGVLCAIDLLVKKRNKWYAYEVKSSTKVKDPFVQDAALQHYVITRSGLPLADISVVHLNNQYKRVGELEVEQLFNAVSVKEPVLSLQDFVEAQIDSFKKVLKSKNIPNILIGDHCKKPYDCNFTNHCGANMLHQRAIGNSNLNKSELKQFLKEWQYPFYFFDFETIMPAIPEFDHSRPYQQIPFQYSLHTQASPRSALNHTAFLGDGVSDPRLPLIKQMLKDLGTEGSIVTWNKSFEVTRIKEMAEDFPRYQKQLSKLIDRIVDLMVPFQKKWYELPSFMGSYSLKYVLPVLVPELSYDSLAIQNGGDASSVYAIIKEQPIAVQMQQRNDLLAYCHLDTLAMVEIYKKLKALVK